MTVETINQSNHKTIFVLDHTPYFGYSCEDPIECDFTKSRGPGFIPLAPVCKSLWTCSVESALEYCRIVWDIYPQGKLISFVVSNSKAHKLNTWSVQQQNLQHLYQSFAMVGAPPPVPAGPEYTVVHGLKTAVGVLCECSDMQHERRTNLTDTSTKVQNRTRLICITSARDDSQIRSYEEYFLSMLLHQNKIAASTDNLIPIHHCHLVMINIYPNNIVSEVVGHPPRDMSAVLTVEAHSVKAGSQLSSKMSHLILAHYSLASTTVTGIPMKEEQNASSSANYDVEIVHPAASHVGILGGSTDASLIRAVREGADYETVTLKWCTPRNCSATELQHCTTMHRITPVDVNSRPSSCLINFLLSGRSVMLEMPRRTGGKVMSHLLAAHGGEIFIHTLATSRSVLEDPPSISEGCGGRVTDYRITDFAAIMRQNKLLPCKRPSNEQTEDSPVQRMKRRLERHTMYWPMTISATVIFNMRSYLDPLLSSMSEELMTDEQVVQCKQVIYSLIGLDAKHEPLNTPNMGQRGKGPKRDEQYRILWNELEMFIRAHSHTEQHKRVLDCLLECRNKQDTRHPKSRDEKVELDQALRELDQLGQGSGGDSNDLQQRASVIRATTDSPLSPPPQAQMPRPLGPAPTLLDIWLNRINAEQTRKKPDFIGRTTTPEGTIARLYPNLKLEGEENENEQTESQGVNANLPKQS